MTTATVSARTKQTRTHPTHNTPNEAARAPRNSERARRFAPLLRTAPDRTQAMLRLTLAIVILPHGAQKLLGWFGGAGFAGTMEMMTGYFGLPALVAFLVILIESVGALALALGFLGRLAAAGVAAVMIGAVATTHWSVGFFMDWGGTQAGEGFEYHLLALALCAAVMIRGSGAASIDRRLAERIAR